VHPKNATKTQKRLDVQFFSLFLFGVREEWLVNATPYLFTPGKDPVLI
jgi:hypothetical protein